MAYNDYNPYQDVLGIYNAKVGYNTAKTDEERKRQNEIANAARKNLEAYGYKDVAEQLSATGADATAARKILEKYAPKTTVTTNTTPKATTAPDSTTLSNNELITTNNNETRNKINQLWGIQTNDRDKYYSEYDKVSNYVNQDVTKTDEYKSAFDKIMPEYDLKAMQGRNNAVASGGASNGGNIDSFAAANALRQQAALKAKGQALAHQIGLDTYNSRVSNARGILSDLGIYQKDSWNAMGNLINQQANEGQRLFENDETAKNNEVARLSEQASVTGYTPIEWTIKNDDVYRTYLKEDGTFKKEMENVDIQALINSAKASGDTETAQKLAAVRARKMLGNYGEFGQYAGQGDVSAIKQQSTEERRQFDKQDALARETLKSESADTRYGIDAEKQINAENNQNTLDVLVKQSELQGGNGEVTKEQLDDVITSFLNSPYKDLNMSDMYYDNWGSTSVSPVYMARTKLKDPDVVKGIVGALEKVGYEGTALKNKLNSIYRQQAIKILQAENKAVTEENIEAELKEMPMPIVL